MKMLQEYWASTVIFIGIISQCIHIFVQFEEKNLSFSKQ